MIKKKYYRVYTGGKEVVFDPYTRKFTIIFDNIVVQVDIGELVKAVEVYGCGDFTLELRRM